MTPQPKRQLSELLLVVGLMLLGLVLRIGVLRHYWNDLNSDPDIYLALATGLRDGQGFLAPGTDTPTAFRPPLYPLILSLVCRPDEQLSRGVLQIVLSLGALPLTWISARQLGLGRLSRLLAVGGMAMDPLLLRYVTYPMTETFCALLIAGLLVCLTRRNSPGPAASFITGCVFGLCVLSRPTFWAFGAVYVCAGGLQALICQTSSNKIISPGIRTFLTRQVLPAALATALCVAPWVIRNLLVMGSPILMTTHGGYTLLLGNNPAFYREVVLQPLGTIWDGSQGAGQAGWVQNLEEQRAALQIDGEQNVDRWMSSLAWKCIRNHPVTFLRAALLKFCWFWNIVPHAPAAAGVSNALRLAVGIYYIGLWACLLGGLIRIGFRGQTLTGSWRQWGAPVLLILIMSAVHLLYWSDARMRAPLMPAVVLVAAALFSPRRPEDPALSVTAHAS